MAETASADAGRVDHARHDEAQIAALLDRDGPDSERATALELVATCQACADLHADLVALTHAARELPVPVRTRDYRLSADDAARLRSMPGEPLGAAARQTGEMRVPTPDHATHDQLLVASLLDRSMDDPDRQRGERLVATCDDCAALHQDLMALREATRALPPPPRPRDFVVLPGDADRLRRSGWRRLVALFGSTGDIFSRPLAIGLTTIGLAGLLVATIPGALSGQGASTAAAPTALQPAAGGAAKAEPLEAAPPSEAAGLAPAAAPSGAPFGAAQLAPSPSPAASGAAAPAPAASSAVGPPIGSAAADSSGQTHPTMSGSGSGQAPGGPESSAATLRNGDDASRVGSNPPGLPLERTGAIVMAGLLLATGLSLFALRWAARRLQDV